MALAGPLFVHLFGLSLLLSSLLIILFPAGIHAECYFASGAIATKRYDSMRPCAMDEKISDYWRTCCFVNDLCLENGLCYAEPNDGKSEPVFYTGACTDKSGEQCARFCRDQGLDSWDTLNVCPDDGSRTQAWYCAHDEGNIQNCASLVMVLTDMRVIGQALDSTQTSGLFVSWEATPTVKMPSPPSISTTTTTSGSGSGKLPSRTGRSSQAAGTTLSSRSGGGLPTETADPGSNGTNSTTTGVPEQPPENNSSHGGGHDPNGTIPLAVGVSIGGSAMVVAAVLGVWLFRKHQRTSPARADSPPPAGPSWVNINRGETLSRMRGF